MRGEERRPITEPNGRFVGLSDRELEELFRVRPPTVLEILSFARRAARSASDASGDSERVGVASRLPRPAAGAAPTRRLRAEPGAGQV